MKKFVSVWIFCFILLGCDAEDAPGCIKAAGDIVNQEFEVASFEEIIVYERVKLFLKQGEQIEVVVETGKNLLKSVRVEVENNQLSVRNNNSCNLFRDYGITKVYVTVPNLRKLQNSSGSAIESIGTLKFDNLWLVSENQARDLSIHTDGDFILNLDVKNLRITNDNYSNYFLKGKVENFNLFFAAGDGRLEAEDLFVQHYDLFHRGTNKLFINPLQSIRGNIYSSGDVISKFKPSTVNVTEHYTGKLRFSSNDSPVSRGD